MNKLNLSRFNDQNSVIQLVKLTEICQEQNIKHICPSYNFSVQQQTCLLIHSSLNTLCYDSEYTQHNQHSSISTLLNRYIPLQCNKDCTTGSKILLTGTEVHVTICSEGYCYTSHNPEQVITSLVSQLVSWCFKPSQPRSQAARELCM